MPRIQPRRFRCRGRLGLALSLCLVFLSPVALFAQTTGTVDGTITDQSNTPLPGVTVTLTSPNLQGTRTAVTSADGRYRFPAVPPGSYTVTAELASFGKVQKKATVTLDATATGWSPRVKLPAPVNVNGTEIGAVFSPSGKSVLFARDTKGPDSGEFFLLREEGYEAWPPECPGTRK